MLSGIDHEVLGTLSRPQASTFPPCCGSHTLSSIYRGLVPKMAASHSSSASPTPPLSSSSSGSVWKRYDSPLSLKRRKINNHPTTSRLTPSSTPDPQLDSARREASHRILSFWSSLEQKYACPLDQDDIFDLGTNTVIKDRGVINSSDRAFEFGCFAEDYPKTDGNENEGIEQEEEDELGGWGSDLELDQQFSKVCFPVRTRLDPADADDLKEFLVAEESRRKAQTFDDESDEENEWEEEEILGDTELKDSSAISNVDKPLVGSKNARAESPLTVLSDESEDELAGYDATVGEGAILWEVSRPSVGHSQTISSKSVPLPRSTPPKPSISSLQLRTPSRSQCSQQNALPSLLPQRTPNSRSPRLFKTPKSLSKSVASVPRTTLTPLTQRLSLIGKEARATSVSPTKRFVPEVVLPKLGTPMLQSKKGKQPERKPFASNTWTLSKVSENHSPSLKRKRSSLCDKITSSIGKPFVEKQVLSDDQDVFLKSSFKDDSRLDGESSKLDISNQPENAPREPSSPPPSEGPLPPPNLSIVPQEDKPRLPQTPTILPQALQYMPLHPSIPPPMPSYPAYASPDWNMNYRQNHLYAPPAYSADPRYYYIAQAMQNLSFLINPVQMGNPQTPWGYPLPPPPEIPGPSSLSAQQTHWSLHPHYPTSSNQESLNTNTTQINDVSTPETRSRKSSLKKVSFSPTLEDDSSRQSCSERSTGSYKNTADNCEKRTKDKK